MRTRTSALAAAVVAGALATAGAAGAVTTDYASTALDIVPAGEYGSIPPPPGADTQARMYDALTPLFGSVTDSQLSQFFKPMTVDSAVPGPAVAESVPRAGVSIVRDGYHVPHITGQTRDDVTWGAGWVVAEDRGLLLQQARYNSLVAAIDAPGVSAISLILGLKQFTPSAQTVREVARQTATLQAAGANGRGVLHDIDIYIEGINAYFAATHQTAAPFTRTDIYAINALKDQYLGEGTGDQARRAQLLAQLQKRYGSRRGLAMWNDLREANDPEAPQSVPGRAGLVPPPRSIAGNVIPDAGSLSASANAALAVDQPGPVQASNVLMVSGARSANHHPIMVAGPQIGFDYPGLIQEMDLNGPGIHQRGATAANLPGYILIGRNQDSAWSLTSAEMGEIDTYVETLCAHSTHKYVFNGHCRAMQLFDAGRIGGKELTFYRTVHGPVFGYARVHGRLVALSRKRSSYGKDVLDLLFYRDLADGNVHNVHDFFRAANETPESFNSFYADDRDIGVFTSGLTPILPKNVDQDLPIDGRGSEEWRGFASAKAHPQGVNPPNGEIINWNNRVQAGYEAPDDNWSLGAVHRVDMLIRNLGMRSGLTPASLVAAMNTAATQDTREMTFEPVLSRLLHGGRAPNARDAQMLALLDAWYRGGGSRLDRTGNGQITDPGAAIMDTAWPLLATAWASAALSPSLQAQLAQIVPKFDEPFNGPLQPNGREMTKGWFTYMDKDLRTIMREPVRGKYSTPYCGGGSLTRCRTLLWRAIDQAGSGLAATQGADPAAWHSSATRERISFQPLGLGGFTMRYSNRPTGIQEIVSFAGHAPADTGR